MRWIKVFCWLTIVAFPAAAQQSSIEQSELVGKLETPAIVTDPARAPKQFHEAPMLAERVKAGTLPAVEQRVSAEPMVIQPLRSIGHYGGIWRRGFLGPGDSENGNRLRSGDKLLFWDETGTKIVPNVAKGYELSADGRRTTLFLRKGMKWSDGAPFGADDFVFWYADLYQNKDLVPTSAPDFSLNGKPGRIVKVDDYTVAIEFDDPYPLFPQLLTGDTSVGGGQSRLQSDGQGFGMYAPAHYLKQFLPKNSSVETLTQQAKAAGYDNWVQYFRYKSDWRLNRELPTVSAWIMTQPVNTQLWVLERNPYFWEVDIAGNQLPYLDRAQLSLAENPEVVNLRAIAGEYDYQERFMDLAKLPVFLENAQRGHYKVHLDLGFNGSDSAMMFNLAYRGDPEVAKWIGNVDFRRALSLALDREQLNQAFWLGLGTIGSVAPAEIMPESPGPDWRARWSTFDVKQANALLDKIGLGKKDRDGFRLRTDNGERLRLQIDVAQTLSPTWPQQAEMVIQQWKAVGVSVDARLFERSLFYTRVRADQNQLVIFSNNGTESLYLYPVLALPVDAINSLMGAAYGQWYASNGARGSKPENAELLHAMELLRGAAGKPADERTKIAQDIWKIAVDQQWAIGLVGQSPAYMGIRVVNERLENVPARTCISQHCRTPWGAHPEQWYYR
jgi:peptide/nickel transport system substrate-binding protein